MARGLVVGLVQTPTQVVESPHLAERGFFVELDHARAGPAPIPRFRLLHRRRKRHGVNPSRSPFGRT